MLKLYSGKFALDFSYDDWAFEFRERLHSRFLELVETNARWDALTAGRPDRAIDMLLRALDVDPEADQLEVLLLSLLNGQAPGPRRLSDTASTQAL